MMRIGIDVVKVEKVRGVFEGREALLNAVFTSRELQAFNGRRGDYARLAAYFAAKEAAFKAFGTGLTGGMDWRDVETANAASGKPCLRFHGATAKLAREQGISGSSLSLSQAGGYTVAVVLLVAEGGLR